jgi:polyferredoxin
MECVNCTACIDACDQVMDKIGKPRGLIRYASLNGIESREPLKVTSRILGYCAILLALGAGLAALLLTRSDIDVTLLRAPGALFQQTADGRVSNLYLLKLTNKTHHQIPVELRLESLPGRLSVLGGELNLPAEKQTEASVLIEVAAPDLSSGKNPVTVGVYSGGRRVESINSIFVGPRK